MSILYLIYFNVDTNVKRLENDLVKNNFIVLINNKTKTNKTASPKPNSNFLCNGIVFKNLGILLSDTLLLTWLFLNSLFLTP